jgi:hypothetical protein
VSLYTYIIIYILYICTIDIPLPCARIANYAHCIAFTLRHSVNDPYDANDLYDSVTICLSDVQRVQAHTS